MIAASIFIASIVATVCAGLDLVALGRHQRDHAGERCRDVPGSAGSAFSAALTSTLTERSRTWIGRSWPFSVHITVRMPRSSASPIASSPRIRRTPRSSSTTCSSPWPQAVQVVEGVERPNVAVRLPGRGELLGRAREQQPVEGRRGGPARPARPSRPRPARPVAAAAAGPRSALVRNGSGQPPGGSPSSPPRKPITESGMS